jgi:DNA-binding GntR family transcriptional regulator
MRMALRWTANHLADEVAEILRDRIVEGRLAPHVPLIQRRLAQDLDVTRAVVGEALRMLYREGLVETVRAGGAMRVAAPDRSWLVATYAVREVLDGLAAGLAARHAGAGIQRRCQAALNEQRAALRSDNQLHWMRADVSFHSAVCDGSGNRALHAPMAAVRSTSRSTMLLGPVRMGQATEEHEAILSAISRRNPDAAEHAARAHVRRTIAALQQLSNDVRAPP